MAWVKREYSEKRFPTTQFADWQYMLLMLDDISADELSGRKRVAELKRERLTQFIAKHVDSKDVRVFNTDQQVSNFLIHVQGFDPVIVQEVMFHEVEHAAKALEYGYNATFLVCLLRFLSDVSFHVSVYFDGTLSIEESLAIAQAPTILSDGDRRKITILNQMKDKKPPTLKEKFLNLIKKHML